MKIKYYFFSICLISVFSHVAAQDLLTAQQAVELVLNNNYAIQIAKNNLTIADKNNSVGNAGMLPTVNATLGDNYTLTNINQQFANGQEINRNDVGGNNLNAAVNLNWTIFDGLRMFATKSRLKKLEEMGELQFKEEVQQTVAQTLLVYYDVVRANQQLKAINETIRIAEERVKLADAKFQVGTAGKTDLLQAKVDLNAQKSNLANQLKVIEQRKADLNALLARAVETDFKTEENIPINLNIKVANEAIDTKNFQVLMAMKNAEVTQQTKREAFSQYLPNLRTNLGYSYVRSQSDAGFSLFNQTYGLNTGFTLTIPLFNGLNTIREVKVAAIQLTSSRFQIEQAKVQQRLGLLRAVKDWTTTKELLLLEEENILLAEENVKIALERFRLGQSISIELREAQKSFEDANARLANTRYAAKVAETELLRLQGELVK
jgi:outer membrane protein TolC